MDNHLVDLVDRQKNKCIRAILGAKEREIDPFIADDVSLRFRKVVLDEINGFYEFVVDTLETLDGGGDVVVNELFLQKIEEIHAAVTRA